MFQDYAGRIVASLVVFYFVFFGVPFVGPGIFNLTRPGIDTLGGISLVYEIKAPPGSTSDLPVQVASALKKRVDPDGVRNLIWLPQGVSRLEIQVPYSPASDRVRKVRQQYLKAHDEIARLNVPPAAVLQAVQMPAGNQRDQRLDELAAGSATRLKTYGEMAQASDAMQAAVKDSAAAKAKGDAAEQNAADDHWAKAKNAFERLRAKVEQSNLSVRQVDVYLDTVNSALRSKKIAELAAQYADSPQRTAALDAYTKAYANYKNLHGAIDDAAELKALLRGAGTLEFHMLADDDTTAADVQKMIKRLQDKGPMPQAGDKLRWYKAERPEEFPVSAHAAGCPQDYNSERYVLASIDPADSLTHQPANGPWALTQAYPETNQAGQQCVGFEFDAQGANLFGKLTGSHLPSGSHKYSLAIILDDNLISAPTINSEIGARGIIEGSRAGYSNAELKYLVNTLNAGALPAELGDEPISERVVLPRVGSQVPERGRQAGLIALIALAILLMGWGRWLSRHWVVELIGLIAWSGLAVMWVAAVLVGGSFTMEQGYLVHKFSPSVHPLGYWSFVAGAFLAALGALALAIGNIVGHGATPPAERGG